MFILIVRAIGMFIHRIRTEGMFNLTDRQEVQYIHHHYSQVEVKVCSSLQSGCSVHSALHSR
jgi:hypothetical protein